VGAGVSVTLTGRVAVDGRGLTVTLTGLVVAETLLMAPLTALLGGDGVVSPSLSPSHVPASLTSLANAAALGVASPPCLAGAVLDSSSALLAAAGLALEMLPRSNSACF